MLNTATVVPMMSAFTWVSLVLVTSPSAASSDTVVTIDFTSTTYPPLVAKCGGVAHPQWDNVTNEVMMQLSNDTSRLDPATLGVIQLGHTMSNDTLPIFKRDHTGVHTIVDPRRLALRSLRGGAGGVQTMLQFDGCPTPAFNINSSSVPSPHARYYPMCAY